VQASKTFDEHEDVIERLDAHVPLNLDAVGENSRNRCDVAVAALLPGVEFIPAFLPEYQMPMPRYICGLKDIGIGDEVWVVGARSGPRRGVLSYFSVVMALQYGGKRVLFEDCFMITGLFGSRISTLDDGGALVIKKDGGVVGVAFGFGGSEIIAYHLRTALDMLRCEMITFSP
jgi:hypothetical protein